MLQGIEDPVRKEKHFSESSIFNVGCQSSYGWSQGLGILNF